MTASRTERRPWALSGVLFVALFMAGLILSGVLGSETYPSPFGPSAEIERYFTASRDAVRMLSFFHALAAIALVSFVAHLAAAVRRTGDETAVLSGLVLGGGVLAAAFMLLSALFSWVLARPATVETPALVRAIHDLAFLTGGPGHVLWFAAFVGASSVAALRTPILPGWIAWVGIVVAVISLLSVASLLLEPASYLLPLGRFSGFVWILAVSVVLARGRPLEAGVRR